MHTFFHTLTHIHSQIYTYTHSVMHTHSYTHMHTLTHMHAHTLTHMNAHSHTCPWQPSAQCPWHVLPVPHLSSPHIANPRHPHVPPTLTVGTTPMQQMRGPHGHLHQTHILNHPDAQSWPPSCQPASSVHHPCRGSGGTSPASPGGQWEEEGSDRRARSLCGGSPGSPGAHSGWLRAGIPWCLCTVP